MRGRGRSPAPQTHNRRRAEIASIVGAQQQLRSAPPRAVEAGQALADPTTVAIVTGQQAGLFGGPLFTLLKAMTALRLAEQVARDHQVPDGGGVLDRCGRSRLGRSPCMHGLRRGAEPADHRAATHADGGPRAGRGCSARRFDPDGASGARGGAARNRIQAAAPGRPSPGVRPWRRHGRRLRSLARTRPRRSRAHRLRRVGPGREAAGRQDIRLRALDTGRDGEARRRRRDGSSGPRLPLAGAGNRREPCALPPRRRAPADSPATTASSSSAPRTTGRLRSCRKRRSTRSASARTSCCVRSCRTRCSRPSVTWRDRTSSPTSDSFGPSTSSSASRCR